MFGRSVWLYVVLAGMCIGFLAASPVLSDAQRMKTAYIRMNAASHEEFAATIRFAENYGAVFRHSVYPYAAMGGILEGSELSLAALPAVKGVFSGAIHREDMIGMSPRELHVAKAYNSVYFRMASTRSDSDFTADEIKRSEEAIPIDPGPLKIPEEYLSEISGIAYEADAAVLAPPPTSEFLLGHVAVGVIMPESDGVGTHDWSNSEEEKMVEEVISAMDYWARNAPGNNLYFTYEFNYRVSVKLEPLDRGGWMIEEKWAGQSLKSLGFEGRNHFDQSYRYISQMRNSYDADWGFIIFLLHGKDGQSFGSFLAYSYLGGPFNVNVSSNGALGPENLDRVIAHETGHTFYTLDEYSVSPDDCSARSGYLDVENANKIDGGSTCKLSIPCIMRGADPLVGIEHLPPCVYTKGQVGWWDEDEDGIPDVLDTDPAVESFALDLEETGDVFAGDALYSSRAVFRGTARSVPLPNMNMRSEASPRHITIEPVSAEYRLDGGAWTSCEADDDKFDGPEEAFIFVLPGLSPWSWHTVDVRSVTKHGNVTPDSLVGSIEFLSVPAPGDDAIVHLTSSNPVRPPVAITFAPRHSSGKSGMFVPVQLAVYDAMGRRITTLASGDYETGRYYSARWDGYDSSGERMPAGIYLIGMNSDGRMTADKVLVIP